MARLEWDRCYQLALPTYAASLASFALARSPQSSGGSAMSWESSGLQIAGLVLLLVSLILFGSSVVRHPGPRRWKHWRAAAVVLFAAAVALSVAYVFIRVPRLIPSALFLFILLVVCFLTYPPILLLTWKGRHRSIVAVERSMHGASEVLIEPPMERYSPPRPPPRRTITIPILDVQPRWDDYNTRYWITVHNTGAPAREVYGFIFTASPIPNWPTEGVYVKWEGTNSSRVPLPTGLTKRIEIATVRQVKDGVRIIFHRSGTDCSGEIEGPFYSRSQLRSRYTQLLEVHVTVITDPASGPITKKFQIKT